MMPMILTVFLNDGEQAVTEVPVTPETTCRDVVEFCKEPGESGCHLAEVWRGNERAIPLEHMMFEHLQKWGPRKQEVKFFLRHEDSPTESSDGQGSQQSQELNRRTGSSSEKHNDNGVGSPRVELTLSELQEMASRQQQQIEVQQQMLVAKEQRLRYLKQQERRQQQCVSEGEKLLKLKERVENQEAKLRKIRAVRGQVDHSKVVNGNLTGEVEAVSGLFQEKQSELQAAVLRVEQLSLQLEELRRGKLHGGKSLSGQVTSGAALELRKLYQELQIRNKLNQDQNQKLQQQKETLNQRNMEVTLMDQRILELRQRLHRKRTELNRPSGPPSPQPATGSLGRVAVAAVGPYIQVPVPVPGYSAPPDPLKPQAPGAVDGTANHARSRSANDGGWPTLGKGNASLKPPDRRESGAQDPQDQTPPPGSPAGPPAPAADKVPDSNKMAATSSSSPVVAKPLPPPYPAHHASASSSLERRKDVPPLPPRPLPNPPPGSASSSSSSASWPRPQTATGSSSQGIQQRISVPPSPTFQPGSPLFPPAPPPPGASEWTDPPFAAAAAVRTLVADRGSRPQSPRKGPATMNSSSIYHMYLQQTAPKGHPLKPAGKAVYGKPVLHSSSVPPSPLPYPSPYGHGGVIELDPEGTDVPDGCRLPSSSSSSPSATPLPPPPPPPSVESFPRPLSPTKLTPMAHSPLRYQSDADLELLRRRLANAPRPLKKRGSITEPEGPAGPNIQKLLYQRFNTLAGGMEAGGGGGGATPFYQPAYLPDADDGNPAEAATASPAVGSAVAPGDQRRLSPSAALDRQRVSSSPCPAASSPPPSPSPPGHAPLPRLATPPAASDRTEDQNNNNQAGSNSPGASPGPVATPPPQKDSSPRSVTPPAPPQVKRTNLKKPLSERTGHGLRVKFNPLALLLDASLEGEFDLVQRIIYEVQNPSTPNDEGITPLHNAVCAGHQHVVKFLLDFGVNVNAADSDGWTPLHCAASCNSVHLCKLLVESGAAIFATTISDVETAADKCEEMEDGYAQCSQFLYGVQEKLGVMNKGAVYALWNYEAQSPDELSFHEGDAITVLRRCDDAETEWWWARLQEQEGYVPRNLLGLYPRIKPRQRSLA